MLETRVRIAKLIARGADHGGDRDRLRRGAVRDGFLHLDASPGCADKGRLAEADLPHLIEEIESLGRAQYHVLRSSYRLVLLHLLKMRHQPERRTPSWTPTVVRERIAIEDCLAANPGLRPRRAEAFAAAYPGARREAAAETTLPLRTFPAACPFSLAQVEDHDVWREDAP